MMKFPENMKITIKNTKVDTPRGTALITGMPRVGKTRLAAEMLASLVGQENIFILDFPEEEGTSTLADLDIAYTTVLKQKDLDEAYRVLSIVKPHGIIWDGLGSSYWMLMKEKVPSGIPPEDHGKTWMSIATTLRGEITRFKTIPSVKWFIATSLTWPDKDEITGKEGRLQVVLPGQLKSNIYGLFSYNMNLMMEAQTNQTTTRVVELQPTVRSVAGIRVPYSWAIPGKLVYDLSVPPGVDSLIKALHLERREVDGESPISTSG